MKKLLIIILTMFSVGHSYGQTDKNRNSVFNSIATKEKSFGDLLLILNYYTMKNNIETKQSSVFISNNPTLDQIEKAAINLPSNFFILTKDSKMVVMVLLQNDPIREFMILEMKTNKQTNFPCKLIGDITEDRAHELVKEKYDSAAIIENGKLKFNGKVFEIITNKEIEEAVYTLIKKEKLDKKKSSDIIIPSKTEIKNYIISETKEGGTLDFLTEIKGKEYDGSQIKPGVYTTNISVALYKWGRACFDIGVNTVEDAYEIFAEFKGTPVSDRDNEYIRMGFYNEWER